ncbi:MAG: helix-turn-helix domain-containing protein [Candidatus Gastranaerophilales bacterium]|nr:helix-turn-helix domain-containing protein [Candidatus Gastranaerophilales bacterium]
MIKELFIYPDGRMDTENAARYLGLSKKTLAQHRSDGGKGPPYIKRGRVFYFKDDLDAWLLEQGKFTSTSQANYIKRKGI